MPRTVLNLTKPDYDYLSEQAYAQERTVPTHILHVLRQGKALPPKPPRAGSPVSVAPKAVIAPHDDDLDPDLDFDD